MKPFIAFSLGLGLLGLAACESSRTTDSSSIAEETTVPAVTVANHDQEVLKRGEYLVNIMGCHDCHSPKVFGPQGPAPDPERLLSGHPQDMPLAAVNKAAMKDWVLFNMHNTAVAGPWGVSFSANLTSDATGIGNWKEEQFVKALREGKFKGLDNTRPLLPPMPWQVFKNLTDEDMHAMFVYLKSTKPVKNVVPAPIPPDQL
ncbi:hypothetical protein SAMN05421823_104231 [Catalinimonas alkaloidigena]|uniref:Cytochrome c domain-containing protein n=1 Tax=Catalinimonas alkaloidigena TaxID=1075417 RepID=A0A1G9GWQ0_9BACT|nr:diheme cytochrome c-553 [Catalinimonas alkaloidigena]SDL04703.1 hypothetical protein SAMN05421823_104231 [Catalinimonas alkaloidigena]